MLYLAMPYKRTRKFRGKRRSYRKKTSSWNSWFQKGVTPKEAIDYAVSGVSYLKGLVNSELYKYDDVLASAVTTSGVISSMNLIAQGDGEGQRTGNSIFVRNIAMQGQAIRNASGATPDSQVVRLVIFQDTQQIADTAPAITDVLETNSVNSYLNKANVGRFKVLFNKKMYLSSQMPQVPFNYFKTLRHHIRFNGSATSDVQKGGLYYFFISNEATNGPSIAMRLRVSYHDN